MRLILFASVASLLLGGCTRDNPAFKADTGSADETSPLTGDGDGDTQEETGSADGSDSAETDASGSSEEGGDGDGDLPLPDCADGFDWITVPVKEDNFVYAGFLSDSGCVLDPGDANSGGQFPPLYGPPQIPCAQLNFGHAPDFFLYTSGEGRSGYLGRLDLERFTDRGIVVNQAHYKFAIPFSGIDGEVALSLAPIREDQETWQAGLGLGNTAIEGESAMVYRNQPESWDGADAFAVVDLSKLLTGQWFFDDVVVEVEVPYGRVQGWLDEAGRKDPGFLLWSDVVEPYFFYVGAKESPSPPALWIEACVEF